MRSSRGRIPAIAALGIVAFGLALGRSAAADPGTGLHLALKKSSPTADEALAESPTAVTLWFTQAPQMSGTSVRVLPQGGEPLELGDARANADDATVVILDVGETLSAGTYQVMWRAMAQDGHTVRGDFSFSVAARR